MKKDINYFWLYCLIIFVLLAFPANSLAGGVLIFKGSAIDEMDSLITLPNGCILTAMEIETASWGTGYNDEDYIIYDMSTKRCSLYDDHSLTTLPEPATLEDAFKTSCLLAFDPDTGLLTLVDGTFAYIYNFGGSNGGSSGGGGETEVDSDGDGLLDDLENTTCTEVNNDDTDGDGLLDGTEDANHNGLLDMGETDPCNKDTDNDGMPDGWEVQYGLNSLINDANENYDGDCASNLLEFLRGTEPNNASSIPKEVGAAFAYTSIQQAVNEANPGEIIVAHDGTYQEMINFMGKTLTLCSENGAFSTILDGSILSGPVVTFNHNEDRNSVLQGFTIKKGSAEKGGGILCLNSSPLIANCILAENEASINGGGLYSGNASPRIINSLFKGNLKNEILNQIRLEDNSGSYNDVQIVNSTNDDRVFIQKYNHNGGKWKAGYRFFGKACLQDTLPLQNNDLLFINFLP